MGGGPPSAAVDRSAPGGACCSGSCWAAGGGGRQVCELLSEAVFETEDEIAVGLERLRHGVEKPVEIDWSLLKVLDPSSILALHPSTTP